MAEVEYMWLCLKSHLYYFSWVVFKFPLPIFLLGCCYLYTKGHSSLSFILVSNIFLPLLICLLNENFGFSPWISHNGVCQSFMSSKICIVTRKAFPITQLYLKKKISCIFFLVLSCFWFLLLALRLSGFLVVVVKP